MARKSTKTARVMNLLANGEPADPEAAKEEAAQVNRAATEAAEAPSAIKELTVLAQKASIQSQEGGISPISIIDMSASAPDPVSELIKEKLEEEENEQIEALTVPQASQDNSDYTGTFPEPSAESVPEGGSHMESENDIEEETKLTLEEEPEVNIETQEIHTEEPEVHTQEQAVSPTGAAPALPQETENQKNSESAPAQPEAVVEEYRYLNIMELLVREKVIQYMNMFDVCTCDRCMADTTALTLTHLPSKYMVVHPDSVSPLLNFYSNKYSQQVVVELTKACSVVKQNPHH